jgi:hypothetical protein
MSVSWAALPMMTISILTDGSDDNDDFTTKWRRLGWTTNHNDKPAMASTPTNYAGEVRINTNF